jgi:hypothetical protein
MAVVKVKREIYVEKLVHSLVTTVMAFHKFNFFDLKYQVQNTGLSLLEQEMCGQQGR